MITTSHTLRYMGHEVRLNRKRLGYNKYGYLLAITKMPLGEALHVKELSLEYEACREYAKSWIENNTK